MRLFAGWTTANRAALGLLVASASLCVSEAAGARRLEPLPTYARAAKPVPMPRVTQRGGGSDAAVLAAVSRDPFRADRRRSPTRLTVGTPIQAPAAEYVEPGAGPSPAASFRLLGTVALPGGGLAVVAGVDGQGRVLRVGQSLGGYRLVRVGPGTATLTGADTTVVLRTTATPQGEPQ
ncbi:MAG TPA: hypothetical protein VGB92_05135 [Longimicrobium sp.]|jgi:hypothetical protein